MYTETTDFPQGKKKLYGAPQEFQRNAHLRTYIIGMPCSKVYMWFESSTRHILPLTTLPFHYAQRASFIMLLSWHDKNCLGFEGNPQLECRL